MGRFLTTFLLLISFIGLCNSQCPNLLSNTTVNGSTNTSIDFCGTSSALFEVNDDNLPNGTIDWYSSTISGFDPLTTGTLLGSSTVTSNHGPCVNCPEIEALFIDACIGGINESREEFAVLSSGSGFSVSDLSFIFDPFVTGGSAANASIIPGSGCEWATGDPSKFTGCSNVIAASPGDYIPANSIVIVQTSFLADLTYDISGMCASECIYVISNSCQRLTAAFKNYDVGVSTTRTNMISLGCGCSDQVTYTVNDPNFAAVDGDGAHVFGDGLTFANNGCNSGPNIGSIPNYSSNSVTTDFNHSFTDAECNTTQYIVGVLNSSEFSTDCCMEQITEEYEFNIACVTAELQGMADLCPGECAEISVLITGGVSPYDLNLSVTGLPFPFNNITLPFVGFPLDDKITICFDNGGPLVDDATFTVDVPAIAGGFSGTLGLNSIFDDNGCEGIINGSTISLSFNNAPDITNPGEQEACDLGDGTGAFILSDLTSIINGGSGATVNYYSDMDGTMPISDPYITSGGSVFAQVMGDPCDSEIIEFMLTVISNGDAGLVSFFCNDPVNGPSTECNICDDDGMLGEDVDLTIIFEDPTLNYEYEVIWTENSGSSSSIMGTGMGMATFTFPIMETTTFVISVVTPEGDCPDITDLGDVVTINYSLAPDMDEPMDLSECGSVTLPDITGSSVPTNAAYYTEAGGMGTMYNPGDVISSNITLYLYGGIENCDEEYEFDITIEEQAMIDDPDDVITCGVYALPEITGTNIDNVSYYTEMDGGGSMVSIGTIISTSVILYLFDSNCGGNQPTLDITITPGPIIENTTDTIVCEMYIVEPIIGIDLSGNEMYFDTTGGNGLIINVGDTLTTDSILFIYDNTGGCEVQVPVFIDIKEPGYPGLDTAITLCEGDPTLININEELGGELPDSTGMWLDINATGIIDDSTQVDFSTLSIGTYLFEYQILDSICVDTHSILTVNIIGSPNAGSDATISICSDTTGVNVFDLLGGPDMSGIFYDESNVIATFDPENADFDASILGSTQYTYVIGNPNLSCGADSSVFTVNVEGSVAAGDDVTDNVCAGNVLDLTTLLANNSGMGTFEEPTPSGGLSGSMFDTEAVADGTYSIWHILDGNGNCPSDTAMLTLVITDAANAGDENEIILCGDDSIILSDFTNGDDGGQFYFNNILLPSDVVTFTGEVGEQEYLYIVGDGVECPFDTAVLTVVRNIQPATFLDIDITELCNDDCTTVTFNAANSGGQSVNLFFHIESNMGEVSNRQQMIGDLMPNVDITFCIGIGDLSNNELQPGTEYTFVIDSIETDNPNCVFMDGSSVTFNTYIAVESELTGTYCTEDEVMVGDDTYDVNMPNGTTTIPGGSATGCDSIIDVDLTFQDFAEGTYLENLCVGESTTVNGTIYTETNTTDEFTITNGSVNGCDSLVRINVFFFDSTSEDYLETICEGDTTMVNGEQFFAGYEMATQNVGLNAMGCDSFVDVAITIEESISSSYTGDFCTSYSIQINGETYDQSNPSGSETLDNQASNGCDSIVMISLTFNQVAVDSTLNISTCDDGYAITIGSETFDISNPSGNVIIPSSDPDACDTTFNVDLIFGELIVDYMEMDNGGCAQIDSGMVIIESAIGDGPYLIQYNGTDTLVTTLPFAIELPVGSGEINVTDNNGCTSLLPYEILQTPGDNFEIIENNGMLSVIGGEFDTVYWSPPDGLSCTDCLNPIANPTQTTYYTATVLYNDMMCSVVIGIEIVVIDNTPDYVLPNVFTPNGDNNNDNFVLTITTGAIGIPQNMRVYDRWGNLVYAGFGEALINDGWDGTLNGTNVTPGVYVYQITVLEGTELITIYGDLTLVR